MAMEKLCMRVRAERVWSQERRWRGGEMDDDHVINKKHSALCRHKAGVSTSAQSSAHRVSAPGSAEGFLFCRISCTISSRTSRKCLELVEPLERSQETELWVPDSHSETRPCKVAATGPLTTISTTPLTLAISPVLPLSLHQHYTPHAELPRYRATLRCFLYLSPLTICFFFPSREQFTLSCSLPLDESAPLTGLYRFHFHPCVSEGRKEEACCDLVRPAPVRLYLGPLVVTGRHLHNNPCITHLIRLQLGYFILCEDCYNVKW